MFSFLRGARSVGTNVTAKNDASLQVNTEDDLQKLASPEAPAPMHEQNVQTNDPDVNILSDNLIRTNSGRISKRISRFSPNALESQKPVMKDAVETSK